MNNSNLRKMLKRIRPLILIPFSYELHLDVKDIRRAKEEIIPGIKVILGRLKDEVGFEVFGREKIVTLGFGPLAIRLKKSDLDEVIRRYRSNLRVERQLSRLGEST